MHSIGSSFRINIVNGWICREQITKSKEKDLRLLVGGRSHTCIRTVVQTISAKYSTQVTKSRACPAKLNRSSGKDLGRAVNAWNRGIFQPDSSSVPLLRSLV